MSYRTINLPFLVKGDVANKVIFTAWMYREAVICGFERIRYLNYYPTRKEIDEKCYDLAKLFTGCSYYADAVCRDIYEIVQSCKELNIKLTDVEFRNWLYFESRGDKRKGNFGIRIIDEDKVIVKLLIDYGVTKDFELHVRRPKSRRFRYMLFETIQFAEQGLVNYNARVYINDYTPNIVKGVVQVSIPEEIWWKYSMRDYSTYSLSEVEYVVGFDVNADNITWCLINLRGELIEKDVIDFSRLRSQGSNAKGCRGFIIQELHKLFNRLKVLEKKKILVSLEDIEVLTKLKLIWIKYGERKSKHWNYWVSIFKPKVVDDIKQVCKQHSIPYVEVDPRGTTHSKEHEKVMKEYKLNRHMTSAYLIAKKGLEKLKQII